tara:strand:- start:545 stop:1381 length:837 start_codon:yes stop_codon:yes gene_type:complete
MNKLFLAILVPSLSAILVSYSQDTQAASFDFTTAEGFASGSNSLNGQNGWVAPAGAVLVNTASDKEFVFVNGTHNSYWGGGTFDPTAGAMTFTTDFKFNANPSANGDVFNVIRLAADPTSSDVARIYFRYIASSDSYRMRYSRGNGFDVDIASSDLFAASAIGQTAGSDAQSNDLSLSWTLTRGATKDAWSSSLALSNLGGADIDIGFGSTIWSTTVDVSDAFHTDTAVSWGFQTAGVNNANVFATSASVAVVPEPSSYALISGLLLCTFIGFRRVRS